MRVAAGNVVVFDRLDANGIHIWRMSADGSDLRQLTSGAGEQVGALSPDGRWVAFVPYDAPGAVSLASVETGKVSAFAPTTGGIAAFSPDGTKLLLAQLEADAQRPLDEDGLDAVRGAGRGAARAVSASPAVPSTPPGAPTGRA